MVDQHRLYLNDNDVIRCRGRLGNSDLSCEAKFPVLLPKESWFTGLIISDCHKRLGHAGFRHTLAQVRTQYWIPQGRAQVIRAIRKCVVCRKWEGRHYSLPPSPPLPSMRVSQSQPFSYTGVDYFGPLYVNAEAADGASKKVWVCLFTCAVIRAVHLEVVQDMTAHQFLMGFRRFISRRGTPKKMIFDNAKYFKLAKLSFDRLWSDAIRSKSVLDYTAGEGIEWLFITELAPWMGGFYERLVGSVKRSMRKMVGAARLNYVQLETVISEVEAIVNSRPLVCIGTEVEDRTVLTPAHFLSGNPKAGLPNVDIDSDADYVPKVDPAKALLQRWKRAQSMLNQFWDIWRNEYHQNLRERELIRSRTVGAVGHQPGIGDVVLIKDSLPRGQWNVARIERLIQGNDGHHRTAVVRLPSGKFLQRAVKLLIPIEFAEERYAEEEPIPPKEPPDKVDDEPKETRKATEIARQKIRQVVVGEDVVTTEDASAT